MARSDFVLGRRATLAAFRKGETFTVSAYIHHGGPGQKHMRYVMYRSKPLSQISYRIRVTPKSGVQL